MEVLMNKELFNLVEICHSNIKNSKECLEYLKNRGIDLDIISKYKIGYFPQNLNTLSKYVDFDVLKKNKIIRVDGMSDYRDYNYLIIPIFDEYANIIGICGRTLMSKEEVKLFGIPKYRNSSFEK